MEKDKKQCDTWREEVQNLLIFAGLFSAVVTAFIIESYKTLQPNPNDAIVALLSVIANRLDNTTTFPVLLSSTAPGLSFSPTKSAIRVNNFWFISLVLSLATVLIGIVSLQWIREHQNYPSVPPRESFALFNMRADGLQKWHVPKIFTALPLLLQSALVLFLGGIIDFLLTFGTTAVTIPVSVVTVLVLLFLVATTVLPTLQGLLLYLPYPYRRSSKTPPAQCPYKSPQGHAFRAILSSILRLCCSNPTRQVDSSGRDGRKWIGRIGFATYILITWTKKTWTESDMAWLRLRDQFMKRSYRRLADRGEHAIDEDFPVFDLTQALMASISSREIGFVANSVIPQYHCFAEVSKWITTCDNWNTSYDEPPQAIIQTMEYVRDILAYNQEIDRSASLSKFCNLAFITPLEGSLRNATISRISLLLHEDTMVFFLQRLHSSRLPVDKVLTNHMLELAARVSTIIYKDEFNISDTTAWPNCLSVYNDIPLYIGDETDYDRKFQLFPQFESRH
ncbi:hypothetical protein GALMADRAFT_564128 [Galerina marginata CBS 339.88]|uniref:DUF6535 domain-containing protein n=1 Tax=Galerina marginata (strain CBS 339.88) TaxID=685588 RepID=A0A067SV57_GALM3|nr:hypothetical protein GALMADRAFT_564128 [Galerina marginata CBS 339.88]